MDKSIYSKSQKELINKLKRARHDAGLDQKQVAELLKRTQSYVSKVESGQRKIDVLQLKAYAKIYDKPISYFVE